MAGAYTDNQPDFSWLQSYETKTFSQYWYPIQEIGPAKNANIDAALNLEFREGSIFAGVCVTGPRTLRVLLTRSGTVLVDESVELAPGKPFTRTLEAPAESPTAFRLAVFDADSRELLSWQPESLPERELPAPATEPLQPKDIESIEELYLTGLHLEQYRHATRSPEAYWREGLRREPDDARLNNAMGVALLRKGLFAEAVQHFVRAVGRLTFRNPNPYDGEVWNYAWQSAGYFWLASISLRRGEFARALDQVDRSLSINAPSLSARALKATILRCMGRAQEARVLVDETLALDPLCFRIMAERSLLSRNPADLKVFLSALDGDVQTLLDVVYDLAWSSLTEDAFLLLECAQDKDVFDHPMIGYTLAWLAARLGRTANAARFVGHAEGASPLYCFPARLEEMIVSVQYIAAHKALGHAAFLNGNAAEALRHFESARHYPENLGEVKHLLTLERDLDYLCGVAAKQLGNGALAQEYSYAAAAPLASIGYHTFFQALALFKLGDAQRARELLTNLADFALTQSAIDPKIDYFATSLPNFLLFEDDLARRNHVECAFLNALAHLRLGEILSAQQELEQVIAEDPNHLAAIEIARWIAAGGEFVLVKTEAESLQ